MTGYKTQKKRRRGTGGPYGAGAVPHGSRTSSDPPQAAAHLPQRGRLLGDGEGFRETRRVYDVWYTPTVKDVYAQLKVAETMLSRCTDPALAIVKRKMYDLEDTMWQFLGG